EQKRASGLFFCACALPVLATRLTAAGRAGARPSREPPSFGDAKRQQKRRVPAGTSTSSMNWGEPSRPAQRLVQLQHLILQRHRGVPAQLADDALAQCFGGLRLAMHYEYPPRWTLEAGQPAHQFITVSMGREHGQLGDLGVDRHPVSVDL